MESRPEIERKSQSDSEYFQRMCRRVVAACDRYDEVHAYWRERELPGPKTLGRAIADPFARRETIERALVGLSMIDDDRAGSLLCWYEPLPGQSADLAFIAKVCRLEWRERVDGACADGSDERAA